MKKICTLLLVLASCFAYTQKVYIPDAAFRTYISSISPTAMAGDSLYILDPTVNSVDSVNISGRGISNLRGIEFFTSMHILEASNNNISVINELPDRIKVFSDGRLNLSYNPISIINSELELIYNLNLSHCNFNSSFGIGGSEWRILDISYNAITDVGMYAYNMESLNASHNHIINFDASASPFLVWINLSHNYLGPSSWFYEGANTKYLDCSYNLLYSFQYVTDSLTHLDISHNYITRDSLHVPQGLEYFNCAYNQLNYLDSFPSTLRNFNGSHNLFDSMPRFNNQLEVLDISENKLFRLGILPAQLKELNCDSTELLRITNLPATLQKLSCKHNHLLCLPALPNTLMQLQAAQNYITCLPNIPLAPGFTADIVPNGGSYITCAPNDSSCMRTVTAKGRVWVDYDDDSFTDYILPNYTVHTKPFTQIAVTAADGYYTMPLHPGVTYTGIAPSEQFIGDTNVFTIPNPGDTLYRDYVLRGGQPASSDVAVYINEIMPAQRWDTAGFYIRVVNQGMYPASGILNVNQGSGTFAYITSSPLGTNNGVHTNFNYYVMPGETQEFMIWLAQVDSNAYTYQVSTNTYLPGDINTANNFASISNPFVAAYQENYKSVSPTSYNGNNMANGEYLEYNIAFKNKGNGMADSVWIVDSLNTRFDMASLQVLGASHAYTLNITGHVLQVNFGNINLPDTLMDETMSHGFFKFKIRFDSTQAYTGSIYNKAYIYFSNGYEETTGSGANVCISTLHISTRQRNIMLYTCGVDSAMGYIVATSSSANNGLNYSWSNGGWQDSTVISETGEYFVTVTDGCQNTAVGSVYIEEEIGTDLFSHIELNTDDCSGAYTGATAVVCNHVGDLYYYWSTGATTAAITGILPNQTYYLTVTDALGRINESWILVPDTSATPVGATVIKEFCAGMLTLEGTGGTPDYVYEWSNGTFGPYLYMVDPGYYQYTVTDALGCTHTDSAEFRTIYDYTSEEVLMLSYASCQSNEPGVLGYHVPEGTYLYNYGTGESYYDDGTIYSSFPELFTFYIYPLDQTQSCNGVVQAQSVIPSQIYVTAEEVAPADCGQSNGEAKFDAPLLQMNYAWEWSNGSPDYALDSLEAGTYTVTVTYANNCTISASVEVTNSGTNLQVTEDVQAASCYGISNGEAVLTATGGTQPYTVTWSNNASGMSVSQLSAGTYAYTLTEAGGCVKADTLVITQPDSIQLSTTVTNAICTTRGSIAVTATGGTTPYSYAWSNNTTGPVAINLTAGTYRVTVSGGANCSVTASAAISQTNSNISAGAQAIDVTCHGGSDGRPAVAPSGGTAPYTYLWHNGSTANQLAMQSAGYHDFTVTDANGCTRSGSVYVDEPDALSLNLTATDATCGAANGIITATASGGTPPYTYIWPGGGNGTQRPAGTYNVRVKDICLGDTATATITINNLTQGGTLVVNESHTNLSCYEANDGTIDIDACGGTGNYTYAWSHGLQGVNPTGLAAGIYTVTVSDGNATITKVIAITQPDTISATAIVTNVACHGGNTGAISLDIQGGAGVYFVQWSTFESDTVITQLNAGTYLYIITDSAGCTANGTATVAGPAALSLSLTATNASCSVANGTIVATAGAGTPPYTYIWPFGLDSAHVLAGTYTVSVTDGCIGDTATAIVTVNSATQGGPLVLSENHTNLSCYGANDGTININACGGSGNYTYTWSNAGQSASLSGLAANTYTVTVSDGNSTVTQVVTLTQPTQITFALNTTCNSFLGQVQSVQGGTVPYSYLWSTGVTGAFLMGTTASGDYSVTVTDALSCSASASVTAARLSNIAYPAVTFTEGLCGANGSVDVESVSFPNIIWTKFDNDTVNGASETYAVAYDTLYHLTVGFTSTQGLCSKDTLIYIPQSSSALHLNVTNLVNPACNGGSTGTITVGVTGGTAPYNYLWNNGATGSTVSNLSMGKIICTATDANGCMVVDSFTLTEPSAILLQVITNDAACYGTATGLIQLNVSGGTGTYNYDWSDTTIGTGGIPAGTYSVTVTDDNGCSIVTTQTITEPVELTGATVAADESVCGAADGSIVASITGGVPGYTYLWSNAQTNATATNLLAGAYTVTVTDANGCSVVYQSEVDCVTGIGTQAALRMALYPNPADDIVYIDVPAGDNYYVTMRDMAGRIVMELSITQNTQIPLSDIAKGMYTVEVKAAHQNISMVEKLAVR